MCGTPQYTHINPFHFIRSALPSPLPTRPSSPTSPQTPQTPGVPRDLQIEDDCFSPHPLLGPRGQIPPPDEKMTNEMLMELHIVAFAENGIGSALDSL